MELDMNQAMNTDHHRLVRHLGWAVLIKLLALLLLWWWFVHDRRVEVDASVMAGQVGSQPAGDHGATVNGVSRDQ